MREVIRVYQNIVAGEVTRFEGHIAKYMGDGVLAYFGWPRAHEDEAERSARAGLAVVQAVARLAIHNSPRPRQTQKAVPSVRMNWATSSLSDLTMHPLISLGFSSFLENTKRNNINMLHVAKTSAPRLLDDLSSVTSATDRFQSAPRTRAACPKMCRPASSSKGGVPAPP